MNRLKFAKTTTMVFFVFGTLLFCLQFLVENVWSITIFGYYYVLFSIVVNLLIVVALLILLIVDKHRMATLKSIGILLLNIPIAYLYFNLSILL